MVYYKIDKEALVCMYVYLLFLNKKKTANWILQIICEAWNKIAVFKLKSLDNWTFWSNCQTKCLKLKLLLL